MDVNNGTNEELQAWYAQFSRDHRVLRNELLEQLEGKEPEPAGQQPFSHSPQVEAYYSQFHQNHGKLRAEFLNRLDQADVVVTSKSTRREWLTGAVPRIVATLGGTAVGGAFLLSGLSRPSYALDDVVGQFQSSRTLHMRGIGHYGFPIEVYFERPHTYWITSHDVRLDENGDASFVVYGHRATNGRIRHKQVDRIQGGTADDLEPSELPYAEHDLPIWAEIETESLISKVLGEEFLFQDVSGFSFYKKELLNGQKCDVFARKVSANVVQRLYVDPTSRMPVGVAGFTKNSNTGKEELTWKFDQITFDPAGPPEHIRFKEFESINLSEVSSPVRRFNRCSVDDRPGVYVPFGLQVGRFSLFCWTAVVPESVSDPTFEWIDSAGNTLDLASRELGKSHDGESEWNWVLLEMPSEFVSAAVSVKYERTTEADSGTSRVPLSLARLTPVDVGMSGVEEVLRHMGTPDQTNRILGQLRSVSAQA